MSNKDSADTTSESAMLKGALLPTVIVGAGCIALFSVIKGIHGFYGALVAQVVVVIFFLVHLLISKLSRNLDPMATMALAMFSYCLLYTSPSPRDRQKSRMPSSA